MSKERRERVVVYRVQWPGYLSAVVLIVACMHYGYSCSACGCAIVDSSGEVKRD